ncbi:class I SAM-dependent methyltransferase [Paenibacillus flagellatus]|uniref:Methyltransferase type 12 domain-containing protein n=1 Tax=Paenibacillus flagellatus TaxID=2211139 RepID=A0A2V5K8S8_9BACL|nr:class I SAM-dependent methyltransferase [Paenibacillus flagellatus]PYI55901.1 hypothetical protein DLM86_09320 [Paenibacillus flagellatus]
MDTDWKIERLDRMLNVTAELFFGKEAELFFRRFEGGRDSLLDIGCGNGAYLGRLAAAYPGLGLTGIDPEERLLRKAKDAPSLAQAARFLHGGYDVLTGDETYDTILARLVVLHLPDRDHWGHWLAERTRERSELVVIDFDDDRYCGDDRLPLFTALYKRARRTLRGPRSFVPLPDALRLALEPYGFERLRVERYEVRADKPDTKRLLRDYMRLATEYMTGEPISAERERELLDWEDDPASDQRIPMFGAVFARRKGDESGKGEGEGERTA